MIHLVLRRFFSRFQNWIALLLLLDFLVMAVTASLLGISEETTNLTARNLTPEQQRIERQLNKVPQPPSGDHVLGTLTNQRDILEGLFNGSRQALTFSLEAGILSACIGVLLGGFAAYKGGWVSGFLMRFSDGLLAVPVITGIVMIRQVQFVMASGEIVNPNPFTGPTQTLAQILEFDALFWAVILINWIPYARLTHAEVTILKNLPFVQAAQALGAGRWRVILRHLLPNAISPAVVLLSRDLGWLVILQASLEFAGFGGGSVWGDQLLAGRNWILGSTGNPLEYWWVWLPGTVQLIVYGICWNLMGDGLNDALNPYFQK